MFKFIQRDAVNGETMSDKAEKKDEATQVVEESKEVENKDAVVEEKPNEEVESQEEEKSVLDEEFDEKRWREQLDKFRSVEKQLKADAALAKKTAKEKEAKLLELSEKVSKTEESEAEKNKEFQQLATERGQVLQELTKTLEATKESYETKIKDYTVRIDTQSELINRLVDDTIKDWPENGKKTIPSKKDASAEERLSRMLVNADLIKDIQVKSGNTPDPINKNAGIKQQSDENKFGVVKNISRYQL